jgi:dihydrofolate synthase / folylpolyglutamate synthase
MTYTEAIQFWFDRINFEVKSARPSDLKLERMRAFLDRLGNPQDCLRIVHITGTKGKGSTAAMLAAIAQAAGYRVGLFTSPHLVAVEERMRVNGESISHGELAALMAQMAPIIREFERSEEFALTFFEIGTALGFLHFLHRRVELAIIEVGLGGRFDSTNVCRPLVSVITSIGFDHMAQLGRTLEEIAFQKAGIIKPGVAVVSGVRELGPAEVIRNIARQHGSPLFAMGKQFGYDYAPPRAVRLRSRTLEYQGTLGLLGEHQAQNAAVTLAAVECLREWGLHFPARAIKEGFPNARWPARIEVVRRQPAVILDSAHNVPAALALIQTLKETFPEARRKVCVFAVSSDKQYSEILTILEGYFDEFVLTRYTSNPRSVPPEKLVGQLRKPYRVEADPARAWSMAQAGIESADLICVTGSVFLAGELGSHLRT